MKYTLSSCMLLTALCVLSLWSAHTIHDAVIKTEIILEEAVEMQLQGDDDKAQNLVLEASNHWDSRQRLFGMLLRHDEVDSVLGEFARLRSYAKTEDEDDFLSNCSALLAKLRHIREMEWPFIQNIL